MHITYWYCIETLCFDKHSKITVLLCLIVSSSQVLLSCKEKPIYKIASQRDDINFDYHGLLFFVTFTNLYNRLLLTVCVVFGLNNHRSLLQNIYSHTSGNYFLLQSHCIDVNV